MWKLEHINVLYRLSSTFPSTHGISIAKCCTNYYWFLNGDFTNVPEQALHWMIGGDLWEWNVRYWRWLKIKGRFFFFLLCRESLLESIELKDMCDCWVKWLLIVKCWAHENEDFIYSIVPMKPLVAEIIHELTCWRYQINIRECYSL